eukprot:TRINITY_DN486_c0_g1_i1.p1 TRINITY_DN486_c0_g1~~TRINITY_DN486_c0_g1_i1.p1  ORF type:complete len:334 (+),score=35.08 TRINITY_DN486_c0_g1_i1:49-1002(+)
MEKDCDFPLQTAQSNKEYRETSAKSKVSTTESEQPIFKREPHSKKSQVSSIENVQPLMPLVAIENHCSFLMPTESSLGKIKRTSCNNAPTEKHSTRQYKSTRNNNSIPYKEKIKEFDRYISECVKLFAPPIKQKAKRKATHWLNRENCQPPNQNLKKETDRSNELINDTLDLPDSSSISELGAENVTDSDCDIEECSIVEESGADPNKPQEIEGRRKTMQKYNELTSNQEKIDGYLNRLSEVEEKYREVLLQLKRDKESKMQSLIKKEMKGGVQKQERTIKKLHETIDEYKKAKQLLKEQQLLENKEIITEYTQVGV